MTNPVVRTLPRCFAACLTTVLLFCCLAAAQTENSAQISGVVTDSSGAAIPGAKVVLSTPGFQATRITDSCGHFSFGQTPRQQISVQASAEGFQSRNVEWKAGSGELEIALAPAGAAEE